MLLEFFAGSVQALFSQHWQLLTLQKLLNKFSYKLLQLDFFKNYIYITI
jgi:hypothetical protein